MRTELKGNSGESAAPWAVTDRPGLTAPAFQFLLAAGGDAFATSLTEDGRVAVLHDQAEAAVETPLAEARRAAAESAVLLLQ